VLKPTSPRQVFAAKVERLQRTWLASPPAWDLPTDADALLRRFCIDDRMHEAWELLAQLDDGDFEFFIDAVLSIIKGVRFLPEFRANYQEWRCQIAEAGTAVAQFIKMCETSPVFASPRQLMQKDDAPLETIGKYFPDLLVQAKEAYLALAAEAGLAWEKEKDDVGDLSRKLGDGRAEMGRDLCHLIKVRTGQPHYEAVAALLNTVLDTGDDEVTADAVRKACARGRAERPDDSIA